MMTLSLSTLLLAVGTIAIEKQIIGAKVRSGTLAFEVNNELSVDGEQ
jgi:hypothetical protein